MTTFVTSDKKLDKLRRRQHHLLMLTAEYIPREWNFPSFVAWTDEQRRMVEIATRNQCAELADPDLTERLELKLIHQLVYTAASRDNLPEAFQNYRPEYDPGTPAAALKSWMPEKPPAISESEGVGLARLAYLLKVADLLASERGAAPTA